jgi:hypothetical protein
MSPEKIGWAVETAARIVPTGSNCLVRAIAGRAMLAHYGFSSRIRLGVRKNDLDHLEGHAWLDYGETIITGENGYRTYAEMPIGEKTRDIARLGILADIPPA